LNKKQNRPKLKKKKKKKPSKKTKTTKIKKKKKKNTINNTNNENIHFIEWSVGFTDDSHALANLFTGRLKWPNEKIGLDSGLDSGLTFIDL